MLGRGYDITPDWSDLDELDDPADMDTDIPQHLQSTFDLLTRAFGPRIEEQDYFALLAFLGEHMCEENIGITIGGRFERDPIEVMNDLAKVQSVAPPSEAAVQAVRSRLVAAGLAEWLEED